MRQIEEVEAASASLAKNKISLTTQAILTRMSEYTKHFFQK